VQVGNSKDAIKTTKSQKTKTNGQTMIYKTLCSKL